MKLDRKAVLHLALAAIFVQILAACGHLPGTSFSAPAWRDDDEIKGPVTVESAIRTAVSRQSLYIKETGEAKNAPQPLDMGLLASGLVAVGSVIYGGHGDIAKGAALTGTGLFGIRNYYAFESKSAVYSAGSDALGCIARVGRTVIAVDAARKSWEELQRRAMSLQSEQAAAIRRLAPTALGAADEIAGEVINVDAEVNKKIEAPTAPDLASIYSAYKERLALIEEETRQNEAAKTTVEQALANASLDDSSDEHKFNEEASIILNNAALVKALTEFSHELEQCRLKVALG